jgi:gluconate 5-dehydrogenase
MSSEHTTSTATTPRGVERFSLAGRVVLVTGARRGLGLHIARGMAAAGATVGVNGRNDAEVEAAASAIPHAFAAAFDITDPRAAIAAVDAIVERQGRIDVLVNNAALRDRRPLNDIDVDDLRRLLETNLIAAYELSRIVARHMESHGGGRLIFVTSMVGPQSFRGDPAYVSSKGGLTALMRALAVELGPKGITANAIAPGFFLTERNAEFFAEPSVLDVRKRIPLQRWGDPDELVGAAVFLASDASSYVNGHVLTVDAGLSIAL